MAAKALAVFGAYSTINSIPDLLTCAWYNSYRVQTAVIDPPSRNQNLPAKMSRWLSQASLPHSAQSSPRRVDDAALFTKARFAHMVMLFLQRESMTLLRRRFFRNPTFSVRTIEMIMWSASLPVIESD